MCELTKPAPGLVVDFVHPSLGWGFAVFALIWWAIFCLRLYIYYRRGELVMSARAAWGLWLLAGILMMIAAIYITCVGWPTDDARRAWLATEEATLSPTCQATVLDPANQAALAWQGGLFLGLTFAPWCATILLGYTIVRRRQRQENPARNPHSSEKACAPSASRLGI